MVLIQLLLPTVVRTTDASHSTVASLADTRRELEQQFDGLTAYTRSIAQGVWTAPDGRTETDEMLLIEVVTEHFESAVVGRLRLAVGIALPAGVDPCARHDD